MIGLMLFKWVHRFIKHEHDWDLHWESWDCGEDYQLFKCKICGKVDIARIMGITSSKRGNPNEYEDMRNY